jgi:hypothetical protein
MGRTHDAAINADIAASETVSANNTLRVTSGWWPFCVIVVAIKFLLLWLDSTPKLLLGDSTSYIWTALTGWIPPDRSYFYGYIVRWLAVWPHSFSPLLLDQALASGAVSG